MVVAMAVERADRTAVYLAEKQAAEMAVSRVVSMAVLMADQWVGRTAELMVDN